MVGIAAKKKKRTILLTMNRKIAQLNIPVETADRSDARIRITLRQLEVFAATARSGSTRAAASHVARSQSAASSALVELEQTLGTPLFDRVGRRLVLNAQGEALLAASMLVLDATREIEGRFGGQLATPLRLAASLTIGEVLLPSLLVLWREQYPEAAVQLTIGNTAQVMQSVLAFEVDMGFIEGARTHPDLRIRPWLVDRLVVVAGPSHPLAKRRLVSAKALGEALWAHREHGSGTREAVDRWLLEHVGAVKVGFEVGSAEAIKRLVARGVALACLSQHAVADEIASGRLVALKTAPAPAQRRLAIVMRRDRPLGNSAKAFLVLCEKAGLA
jgi:DNA-binding transcriptional LysR family regulator